MPVLLSLIRRPVGDQANGMKARFVRPGSMLAFRNRVIRMTSRLRLIPLLIAALVACTISARAQDKGSLNPQPLPPLANPNDPTTRGEAVVRAESAAGGDADPVDRRLHQGLSCRRRADAASTATPGR